MADSNDIPTPVLQNLVALSAKALAGERVIVEPAGMSELWGQVAQAEAALKARQKPAEAPEG